MDPPGLLAAEPTESESMRNLVRRTRGILETGRLIVSCIAQLIRAPARSANARYVLNHLKWLERDEIPSAYLTQLFPEGADAEVTVKIDVEHPYELPYGERLLLASMAQIIQPSTIFEFGTFTGRTTKLLADAAPDAIIHTLDLPDEEIKWEEWMREVIGTAFSAEDAYTSRIIQHRVNSRKFDFQPLRGAVDLVFVDASHAYGDVLHDSHRALEIVSPQGVVLWDDYDPNQAGVVSALREIGRGGVSLARISKSRLVVHKPAGWT